MTDEAPVIAWGQVPLDHSRQAHLLQMPGVSYISDSQDLEQLCEELGWTMEASGITGAFVRIGDHEVSEVWTTDWSRPYAANCLYTRQR